MLAPLARSADASSRLRWFLERALDRIRKEAPNAVAVDLVGSLARGEGTVVQLGNRPLVLSDLDLAVVLPDRKARDLAAPRLARASRELAAEFTAWDFLGAVDIGAYATRDLRLQAARPGTMEWARSGVTLAGDPAWRARLPVPLPRAIPLEEILLLLENRLLELLSVHPDCAQPGRRAWVAAYAGGKGVLDAALARLLVAGECPPSVGERARAYADWVRRTPSEPSGNSVDFWTAFKLTPDPASLVERYGRDLDSMEWAPLAWREGGRALLAVYRDVVVEHWPGDDAAWLARAAGRARLRRRARRAFDAWREASQRGLSWGRLGNVGAFAGVGAPEHVLGATAAALVAEAVGDSEFPSLPPGSARLRGFITAPGAAPWEERRRQAVQVWDRWVLRGARTPEGGEA